MQSDTFCKAMCSGWEAIGEYPYNYLMGRFERQRLRKNSISNWKTYSTFRTKLGDALWNDLHTVSERRRRSRGSATAPIQTLTQSSWRDCATVTRIGATESKTQPSTSTKALEHDPEFGLAHATLSYVCMNLHDLFEPKRELLDKAERHYRTALDLDPSLPEAHMARSWILRSPAKNFQARRSHRLARTRARAAAQSRTRP